MAWYPAPRGTFAQFSSPRLGDASIVVPWDSSADPKTANFQLLRAIGIGIGVSLGTTIAWTIIDHFFDFRKK